MNTKHFIAMLLALCLVFGLCACGGNTDNTEAPTTGSTAATTQPVETTVAAQPSHTVKIVDEGGNPIAGAFVQMCLETCTPAQTDDNGVAYFYDMAEADYEVKLMAMPQGYGYVTEEQVFHFADGSNELTITLKAVA